MLNFAIFGVEIGVRYENQCILIQIVGCENPNFKTLETGTESQWKTVVKIETGVQPLTRRRLLLTPSAPLIDACTVIHHHTDQTPK